jgi:hypothetical protein
MSSTLSISRSLTKLVKSREYVTNTMRVLLLPEHMLTALSEKRINEGHTRPLLMLTDRKEEQETLFKEIMFKKLTVREAEGLARRIAVERARKKEPPTDPELLMLQTKLNEALGTRVQIEQKEKGGKIVIDFFDNGDLKHILELVQEKRAGFNASTPAEVVQAAAPLSAQPLTASIDDAASAIVGDTTDIDNTIDDSLPASQTDDSDLYSIKNFSV